MQLTKNFKLEEFTNSYTAEQKGIDNTPNEEQLENIKFLAEQLQIIRNAYKKPIFIVGGFRSKELNAAVGGSKTSQHMQGLAADIDQGTRQKNKNLFDLIKSLMKVGLPVHQLINEYDYDWIHIGFKKENPRGQIFKIV